MEVLVDVAVKHPCTPSMQAGGAREYGFAAGVAEYEKLREYRMPQGKVLTPFGCETFGRLGVHAEGLLTKMVLAGSSAAPP